MFLHIDEVVSDEQFEPVSPLEIHSDFGDELDELDLGLAHLRVRVSILLTA